MISFTQKLFEDYNQQIMDTFVKKMKGINIDDFCQDGSFGEAFTTEICITDQNLIKFGIDTD